jgi:phage baseplate assembly protein W
MSDGRHLKFPFHIGGDGRTAAPATLDEHIRDEIMQLLLTNPGERPFIPSFGGGLRRLVFERNDDVAAGLGKSAISQALSYWLGHRVNVEKLEVTNDDATVAIDLTYRNTVTDEVSRVRFEREE